MTNLKVQPFFDIETSTVTYCVFDSTTRDAVVIDSVMGVDTASGRVTDGPLRPVLGFIATNLLRVHYVLETHAHADHLSGAQLIKKKIPDARLGIGRRIVEVQKTFKSVFNFDQSFVPDGRDFDRLLNDDETFSAGSLNVKVIATPGHTPACVSYLIGDALFTGDVLMMPDTGTGRCDFPGGSARSLYASVSQHLYSLPDATRVFVGHDYSGGGKREPRWATTIGEQKRGNVHIAVETTETQYLNFRDARDATLAVPKLLYVSLQVNIRGGHLPPAEANGQRYFKIPVALLDRGD